MHTHHRRLIRLILTAPVFEIFCALGVWNYHITDYMLPIARLYEAFSFVAALYLCIFLLVWTTDWNTQVQYFSQPENHGFKFFRRRYILVTQILPSTFILTVIELVTYGVECIRSNQFRIVHLVVSVLHAIVIICAISGMLPFLRKHSTKLKASEPTVWGKLLVFKGIVFIQMIQSLILSILGLTDTLVPTATLSYNDVNRGLNPFITCMVVLILSIMMIYYYNPRLHGTHGDYQHSGQPGDYYHYQQVQPVDSGESGAKRIVNPRMPFWRAIIDTINMTDVFIGMGRAAKLIFKKHAGVPEQLK
jgi:hypothetical protein